MVCEGLLGEALLQPQLSYPLSEHHLQVLHPISLEAGRRLIYSRLEDSLDMAYDIVWI
jgi:hypothetical protein